MASANVSANLKPMTVFSHDRGPNPKKVLLVLEALKIPYKVIEKEFGDGPNGVKVDRRNDVVLLHRTDTRVARGLPEVESQWEGPRTPYARAIGSRIVTADLAAVDPNQDDLVVWESGAILMYLEKFYDQGNTIGSKDVKKQIEINSWLFFQVSGPGPAQGLYPSRDVVPCPTKLTRTGQVNWFLHFHDTKNEDALKRYVNEANRCYQVLDKQIGSNKFICGDKFTLADAAFYVSELHNVPGPTTPADGTPALGRDCRLRQADAASKCAAMGRRDVEAGLCQEDLPRELVGTTSSSGRSGGGGSSSNPTSCSRAAQTKKREGARAPPTIPPLCPVHLVDRTNSAGRPSTAGGQLWLSVSVGQRRTRIVCGYP